MTPRVAPEIIDIAEASFRRCGQGGFYRAFYGRLLDSDPGIREMFAKTDFDRQNKLLQHALGLLLAYGRPGNGTILDRIAQRHRRTDLNIPPSLYPNFVEALLVTVKEFDPQYSAEVDAAWRAAIAPGIAYMGDIYQR